MNDPFAIEIPPAIRAAIDRIFRGATTVTIESDCRSVTITVILPGESPLTFAHLKALAQALGIDQFGIAHTPTPEGRGFRFLYFPSLPKMVLNR